VSFQSGTIGYRRQMSGSKSEVFARYVEEYYQVAAEESPEFIAGKREVEEAYAAQFRAIENFRRSKRVLVLQEGLYLQQLKDDQNLTE
jgi:hypothetical protein